MSTTLPLPHHAAVPLAHALAWEVARTQGMRALIIKGPASSHHGLREPRVSADADIWIEPDRVEEYLRALEDLGWHERPVTRASRELLLHSATVEHPQWPCDLDVHRLFPGFLVSPALAFDALWERRQALTLAGVTVEIPDRPSSILISALHALRSPHQTPRHAEELKRLAVLLPDLPVEERRDVLALAQQVGAVDSARPALEHLEIELPAAAAHGADGALDAWRARTAGSGDRTSQFVLYIRDLPWRQRPAATARALWPSEADFRIEHGETAPGAWAAARGRLARVGRGLAATPALIRGLLLSRRGKTDDALLRRRSER